MITQQVTAIALRLFAIWLLVQLALGLPSLMILLSNVEQYQQEGIPLMAYLGVIGAFLVTGCITAYLIYKASKSILTQVKSSSEAILSIDSQKVLFQLAGLYFVVTALARLPNSLAYIPYSNEISTASMLWPAGLVFQLVIGVWLATSSTFWQALFIRLRGRA